MGKRQNKNNNKKQREDDKFSHLEDSREEQDVSGIIPYDIDNQIAYMDDVLQQDKTFESMLSLDANQDDKQEDKQETALDKKQNFSIEKFWEKVHDLELVLSLVFRQGHLKIVGSEEILLNNLSLELEKIKQPAAILTRKATTPSLSDKDSSLPANYDLNKRMLFPIFAKDVFSIKISFDKPLLFAQNIFADSENEDVLKVSNSSKTEQSTGKITFFTNKYISKCVILKQSDEELFHKECEEMRTKGSPDFQINVSKPGVYIITFYEPLARKKSSEVPAAIKTIKHDYIFRYADQSVHLSEFPYKKLIKT